MPLEFLRRRSPAGESATATSPAGRPRLAMPEEAVAQEYVLRLTYGGKSSEGVRLSGGPVALAQLPHMLDGIARSPVEAVDPLPVGLGGAAPSIVRPAEASQWLEARASLSPIARHALLVLESLDALDLAYDAFAVALLDGTVDTSGYPEYSAIVGGVASHWDEGTGDLICRAVVGWGGRGAKGDTDRTAGRILSEILSNILASSYALEMTTLDRPLGGGGGSVCGHCGFAIGHDRAFYCPKCGMRLAAQ